MSGVTGNNYAIRGAIFIYLHHNTMHVTKRSGLRTYMLFQPPTFSTYDKCIDHLRIHLQVSNISPKSDTHARINNDLDTRVLNDIMTR